MKAKIIYKITQNLGETFDDEENFSGFETRTTVEETIVEWEKVYDVISSIYEMAADYGDGITSGDVLAICDAESLEILPKDLEYWKPVDENEVSWYE